MGYLLETSQTLSYLDSKDIIQYVKEHGVIQFLLLYKKFKGLNAEKIYWGDEIELHILSMDPVTNIPKLQLNNEYIFESHQSSEFSLLPEFGAWMVETIPGEPYSFTGNPEIVLENFKTRRQTISSCCKEGDFLFAGTAFPLLGVEDYYVPRFKNQDTIAEDNGGLDEEKEQIISSKTIPTFNGDLLNSHPRYATVIQNVLQMRGQEISIRIPIYKDENTLLEKTHEEPYPGFIHMNDALFGAGNGSMQITFGARNVDEARYLTDQLAVFSSIMLPLSSASAIFKGKLSDVDNRWPLLTQCLDYRTEEKLDSNHPNYTPRSRWSHISRYISNRPEHKEEYNDAPYSACPEMMKFAEEKAKELGVELDDKLLKHIGFLFHQDPLVIYADKIFVDDNTSTNHFEGQQSTNWNNVRFKPPPSFDSNVGWRVELRPVETQLTAEESVSYVMFSYFVAEMLMKKGYNFYIPISKLDENFARASKRDALLSEKFWFRKDVQRDSPDEWIELTIDEILHGKADLFVGLFNLVYGFISEQYNVDIQAQWAKKQQNNEEKIDKVTENMKFFELLSKRARGETPTIASWMRSFVVKHPKYQKDSLVSVEIATDLIKAMNDISDGKKVCSDFI